MSLTVHCAECERRGNLGARFLASLGMTRFKYLCGTALSFDIVRSK